jgi:hypothetical protein
MKTGAGRAEIMKADAGRGRDHEAGGLRPIRRQDDQ